MNVQKEKITNESHPKLWECLWSIYHQDVPAQIRVRQAHFFYPTAYISADESEKLLEKMSPEELAGFAAGEHTEMEEITKKYGLEKVHQALNDFFEGGDDYLASSVTKVAHAILGGEHDGSSGSD